MLPTRRLQILCHRSLPYKLLRSSSVNLSSWIPINFSILLIAFFENSMEQHEAHNYKKSQDFSSLTGKIDPNVYINLSTFKMWANFIWIVLLQSQRNVGEDLALVFSIAFFFKKVAIIALLIRWNFVFRIHYLCIGIIFSLKRSTYTWMNMVFNS